ncbi:hypothetical protein ACJMK2_025508, partial [Sinanodonta woodiana]
MASELKGLGPYESLLKTLTICGEEFRYFSLSDLKDPRYEKLPFSVRVLLESAIRNCDNFHILEKDVENILNWEENQSKSVEIPFKPSRVILQDFTGVPAVVDFAAMRDAMEELGGDPESINPICPADLVIDHSIQVDISRSAGALEKNQELEYERNKERFVFLKWGAQALKNLQIVPPGSGIVHQVNLEYLARVVFNVDNMLYPDSLVGTDSHTTMINGLGVVGWGVGGIEAEAVMLGQSISMVLPEVLGYKLTGTVNPMITSTDIVLTITKHLRTVGVVGKFVEFFGPGVTELSIADRATISNMCPEYGATVGFFPIDEKSIEYLRQTGLLAKKAVEAGLKVKPYIKTSLSPGSGVVTYYLRESGVTPYLDKLGFDIVGYGCMTCIGNSGPLPESVAGAIEK